MLACIACQKQLGDGSQRYHEDENDSGDDTLRARQEIKALTAQIKDMTVEVSRSNRRCKSTVAAGSLPYEKSSVSTEADEEPREWTAQVEPGVLLHLFSLSRGGNILRRIRFSREMFNKWQAQRWWAENHDKVMELYNITTFNRQAVSLPTPPRSEDETSKMESAQVSPMIQYPPRKGQQLPCHYCRPLSSTCTCGMVYSLESVEVSSMEDSSGRGSSPQMAHGSVEFSPSPSFTSVQERELVEEDEPGVHITICVLPGGFRELRRIRFGREMFGEKHARLWWEENRSRIQHQYLS